MANKTQRTVLVCALLSAATLIAFWPMMSNEFVFYDDPDYLTTNPQVQQGLTWPSIIWAFTTYTAGNWHPLTWLSNMVVVDLFGMNPAMHHLANLVLHIASAVLLFLVLQRMTGGGGKPRIPQGGTNPAGRDEFYGKEREPVGSDTTWQCAFVAALFALHPMHVESVAWLAERKDALCGFFFMLTLMAYVKYVESRVQSPESRVGKENSNSPSPYPMASQARHDLVSPQETISSRNVVPGGEGAAEDAKSKVTEPVSRVQYSVFSDRVARRWYFAALFFFACGLMSKAMLVTVPFLLLLLDFWPLHRFELNTENWKLKTFLPCLREKVPFFALSAVVSVLTFKAQKSRGALDLIQGLSLTARIENAVVSYCRYLGKLFWPVHLSAFYPHPGHWPFGIVALAGLLLVSISVITFLLRRERPSLIVGWLWFLGSLVPVIGLVQAGLQGIADRYTYLPYIGLFIMISCFEPLARSSRSRHGGKAPSSPGEESQSPPAVAGSAATRPMGRGSVPPLVLPIAGMLLALALLTQNQTKYWRTTRGLFEHAVAVAPDSAVARNNLGGCLMSAGETEAAERQFAEAVRLQPNYRLCVINLAGCLSAKPERWAEATALYERALKIDDAAPTHYYFACLLLKEEKLPEAESHLRSALERNPDYFEAHYNLGVLEHKLHKYDESARAFEAAIRLRPGVAQAEFELGEVLLDQQNYYDAIDHFRAGLVAIPGHVEGRRSLGIAQVLQGRFADAVPQLEFALKAGPDAKTEYYLGLALHGQGEFGGALTHYREAVKLAPDNPDYLNDLAWLLATCPKSGVRDGKEAVRIAEKACQLRGQAEPRFWGTLDAAYAEAGRFEEAIVTAQKTHDLAAAAGQKDVADAAQGRLALYRSHKPYRL